MTYDGIDSVRQACGGAGYLEWSGLPHMQLTYSPLTTLEGDNTVMMQQCSRLIFGSMKTLSQGKSLTGVFSYLNSLPTMFDAKASLKTP